MSHELHYVAPPAVVRLADRVLLALDSRIDEAEGDGIRARWEFGRELLRERVGRLLPRGRLDELVAATGKSRDELQARMRFANRFRTERQLLDAIQQFGSWYRIWHEALPEAGGGRNVHYSSSRDDWETPQALFDLLDAEFRFELDVCATDETAKCVRYFTPADDGLAQEWRGACWMNPPYGEAIGDWIAKASAAAADAATVVCLVPARVDTAWWWDYCRHGEVRFLRGRLRFDSADAGAPFPSAVVVFPRKPRVVWWEAWK